MVLLHVMQPLKDHESTLTCPSIAVLLAHISSLLQQNPGAVQVAQRDGQVQRSPTSRVQRLQVALRVNTEKRDWVIL